MVHAKNLYFSFIGLLRYLLWMLDVFPEPICFFYGFGNSKETTILNFVGNVHAI